MYKGKCTLYFYDAVLFFQAHLFSLGMTLLYAAEYNVESTKEAVTPELREILGRMTADDPNMRPDLESTIILCEEQLCGQSSQEVCCGIAAVVGFGIPTEGMFMRVCLYRITLNHYDHL